MAIYHLEAKIVTRGEGRSAVAASAYMSCSRMLNDYDRVQHDYTRKQGLIWQQVFLPPMAPFEWTDREKLWNAVEEAEKAKDGRLAREFVAALPIELGRDQWTALLTDFIQANFVDDGMCADVAIHDTDGHNPHAHILLTVRPLAEKGKWQYKTEKEYLCVRDGEERGFTAAEFKDAQKEGWEKQYQYKVGKKKVYMTPSAAEAQSLERLSKNPKSTRYGRQNPITERWNSEEQLVLWRKAWADVVNLALEQAGREERIDHRSHAERGLDEQPTIHEGVIARAMEREGHISERCEINRQIRADNALLRKLKEHVQKLTAIVVGGVAAIAEAMENLRQKMIVFRYHLLYIAEGKGKIGETLKAVKPELKRYKTFVQKISAKVKERKALLAEKKATPAIRVLRHHELAQQIATLTEDLEELQSEKAILLNRLDISDKSGMAAFRERIASMEAKLETLERQEVRYAADLDAALAEFAQMKEQVADVDPAELEAAKAVIRSGKDLETAKELQATYGKLYNRQRLSQSKEDVASMLGKSDEHKSVREQLQQQLKTSEYSNKKSRQER